MKLAEKILRNYNGKEHDFNTEAGDTSFDNHHYHKTVVDVEGNGVTVKTYPLDIEHHVHEVIKWDVQEVNDHVHDIIS